MSKLEELIRELCPDGVEYKPLEGCCKILDNQRKPVTKAARVSGAYPYYGANGIQDYVADYIFDGTYVLVGEDGSVLTKVGTPVVTWATGKIWVNNHAHIIEEIDGALLRYLFHYIQTINISSLIHGNIPKLTGKDFKALSIPIPPLPVQAEIVRILDNFTELTTELTMELTARKKQYKYYKNSLITFDHTIAFLPLNDVMNFRNGKGHEKNIVSDGRDIVVNSKFISTDGLAKKYSNSQIEPVCVDDVLMVMSDLPNGKALAKCFIVEEDDKYTLNQRICALSVKDKTAYSAKFLYYYLNRNPQLLKFDNGCDQTNLKKADILNIKIPAVSLPEQERIVSILDRFDTFCNDISEGLPAEIEARQKQYEYYRDKLLSFKEA